MNNPTPNAPATRGQTSVEYLLLIAVAIVFVTIIAYVVKNRVLAG